MNFATSEHRSLLQCNNDAWSQKRTAKDLGISQPAVTKAIEIATAIEEHPGLVKLHSGQAILTPPGVRLPRYLSADNRHAWHLGTLNCILL